MPRHRLMLIGACVVGLLVLAGLAWRAGVFNSAPSGGPGGPFQLVDQNTQPVTEKVLKGKWNVVFFGYTYCPDVCPTTLAAMGQTQAQLGPKAKDVQFIFVSVDPERDTPATLKAYLSNDAFPKGTIGLTGSPAQVAAAAKAYKVFYEKSGTGRDYTVNHFAASFLMDPKGHFARILPYGIGPDEVAKQIADAMRG